MKVHLITMVLPLSPKAMHSPLFPLTTKSSFIKEGWTLKLVEVNKGLNLEGGGGENLESIDLCHKIRILDVIAANIVMSSS